MLRSVMTQRDLGNHYFKEWRTHRKLSLAKVVARMESEPGGEPIISGMSLSRIERGQQPYSEEVVNALATVYECEPWMLFKVNPLKDGAVVDLMAYISKRVSPAQAGRALDLLKIGMGD